VYEELLNKLVQYKKVLEGFLVFSDHDNNFITQAKSLLAEVKKLLWEHGQ